MIHQNLFLGFTINIQGDRGDSSTCRFSFKYVRERSQNSSFVRVSKNSGNFISALSGGKI